MDIQTATIIITGIGVLIAAVNQIYTSRQANQQRQTQLFMDLYNRWNTKQFAQIYGSLRYQQKGYEEFNQLWEQHGDYTSHLKDVDNYSEYQTFATFFEGIGVLVRRGLIDIDVVEDLFANRIIWWWETWQPISKDARDATGDPKLHDHTLFLYNEMKKRQQSALST
jgi:hypothetical protein